MRIIGGQASGQLLKFPKNKKTRPVTDRVREAVFSIINDRIKNSYVLDLYAGSGSLGIEALSRGAEKAVFVDENKICFQIIKQNIEKIGFLSQAKIKKEKSEKFLKENKDKFDLIFIDPPWQKINSEVLGLLYKFLKTKGIIIFSHPKKFDAFDIKNLIVFDQRQYGDAGITFLKFKENL